MAIQDTHTFLRDYTKSLHEGVAALFVGAGLSRQQGYVNWRELLSGIAKELGLDANQEHDLIALAQFHHNKTGNRGRINQQLVDEFTKEAIPSENHNIIARLPIRTIWTTNYDLLIEDAFRATGRKLERKLKESNFATTRPNSDAILYKMHGDVESPNEAVLTKEDYEAYSVNYPLFTEALKGDLVSKSFLFLGFSFEDPNIDYILSRIRILLGKNQRPHYCIMKEELVPSSAKGKIKAEAEYKRKKQKLRIEDLKRYSIQVVLIQDYNEITTILNALEWRSKLRDVLVSGAAHDCEPLGSARLYDLCEKIGNTIISQRFNLVSGFGAGIGGHVIAGAINKCYTEKISMDHLKLRPFPQGLSITKQNSIYSAIRTDMVSRSGFVIFISGNKFDDKLNKAVPAAGMEEEFELAKATNKILIPVGATGYLAEKYWEIIRKDLKTYYPNLNIKQDFETLGDKKKSNDQIVQAIFSIIKTVQEA